MVASFVALTVIAYNTAKDSIVSKTEDLLRAQTTVAASDIENWNIKNQQTFDAVANTIETLHLSDAETLEYFKGYYNVNEEYPNGFYLATENNELIDASGWEPEGDLRESEWYQAGLDDQFFQMGKPYIDELTGEQIVSSTRFIENFNGRSAVVSIDIKLTSVTNVVIGMDVVGKGGAVVVDVSSGSIIADNKYLELVGRNIHEDGNELYKRIGKIVKSYKIGLQSVEVDGTAYEIVLDQIEGTSWYLVTYTESDSVYGELTTLTTLLLSVGAGVTVLMCIVLTILIRSITKPLHKLAFLDCMLVMKK